MEFFIKGSIVTIIYLVIIVATVLFLRGSKDEGKEEENEE